MIKRVIYMALLLTMTVIWACRKDNTGERSDFDRAAMLENYAVNLIRPAYQELLQAATLLTSSWEAFEDDPTEATLSVLRAQWLQTALAWQAANAFNFGPAGEEGLRKSLVEEIGAFPVDAERIEELIDVAEVSLNNFDRDSRGILAVEYLLYSTGGNSPDVLTALQQSNRSAYLAAILRHLQEEAARAVDAWAVYQAEFQANDGTDAGSAASQLYNEFVRSFEAAKNFKVALPAGNRAGQTQAEPQLVEAYYSGKSLDLLKAHLASIERIYYGAGLSGADGIGFYEYLQEVEGGPALVQSTEAQWTQVKAALAEVPAGDTFSGLITAADASVDKLHTELQKQTRFFKSDMSSLLGIAITYSSGDGD